MAGWADKDRAAAYEQHYRSEVSQELRSVPGFVGARLLRRAVGDKVEFVSLTFFDDLESVRRFAGSGYETAVVAEAARRVLTRFDNTVTHYDVSVEV